MKRRRLLLATAMLATLAAGAARAGAYEDFFIALGNDDAGAIAGLMQRGFDPNTVDEKGQPALLLAMRDGAFRVAELLLRSPQLKVDQANASGETPLMMAALKGHTEWVRRLVERGAAVNREGWTPLHYAATGPQPAIVSWLLDQGAAIDARSPNATTPLMMAARYGAEDSARVLIARGADPRLRNQRNLTAGDFARAAGRDKLGERLDQALR